MRGDGIFDKARGVYFVEKGFFIFWSVSLRGFPAWADLFIDEIFEYE